MPGYLRIIVVFLLSGALFLSIAGCEKKESPKATGSPAVEQAASTPLRVRETNVAGVTAELTECKRKDGVLTVQIRLRNGGDKAVTFYPVSGKNFDAYYVTAEDKKYFVLRDEEKTALAPATNPVGDVFVSLKPGDIWLWWAKYPAPPPAVKTISYMTSLTTPFDDIAISDL